MSGTARISNRDFAIAIGLILLSAAALGGVSLFGKLLTGSFDLPGALFMRFFVPLLLLGWMLFVVNEHGLNWGDWRVHLARSGFALGAQFCFFYYLSQGSLLFGTLLFSTSGLFLPFLTRLAFGMEIRRQTLIAVVVSFAGVAVILDPRGGIDVAMLIGLLAGLFNAGSQATQHRQSKGTSTLAATIVMFTLCSLYCAVILTVVGDWGALFAAFGPEGHRTTLLLVAVGFAFLTISNQALRSRAFGYVNKPASLTPFYYAAIVFSGILDWLVYDQRPAAHVYAGMALIFIGGVIMAWRGKVRTDPADASQA